MTISWFLSGLQSCMKGLALSLNLKFSICFFIWVFSLDFEHVTFRCFVWMVFLMSLFSCIVMRTSQSCWSRRCSHVPCGVLQFLLYQLWVYLWSFTQCQISSTFPTQISNTLAVCGARLGLAKNCQNIVFTSFSCFCW